MAGLVEKNTDAENGEIYKELNVHFLEVNMRCYMSRSVVKNYCIHQWY